MHALLVGKVCHPLFAKQTSLLSNHTPANTRDIQEPDYHHHFCQGQT